MVVAVNNNNAKFGLRRNRQREGEKFELGERGGDALNDRER